MNLLSPPTAPCQGIFFSNLSNTDEIALVTNLGNTSLAKGTAKDLIILFRQSYLTFCQEINLGELFKTTEIY